VYEDGGTPYLLYTGVDNAKARIVQARATDATLAFNPRGKGGDFEEVGTIFLMLPLVLLEELDVFVAPRHIAAGRLTLAALEIGQCREGLVG